MSREAHRQHLQREIDIRNAARGARQAGVLTSAMRLYADLACDRADGLLLTWGGRARVHLPGQGPGLGPGAAAGRIARGLRDGRRGGQRGAGAAALPVAPHRHRPLRSVACLRKRLKPLSYASF